MQKSGLLKRILSMLAVAVLVLGCVGVPFPMQEADAEETVLPYLNTNFSFEERAADLVSRMTIEEKASLLGNNTQGVARLGVAKYDYWSEGLHGVARSGEATSFPYSIAMAATWDPDLIRQITDATADEARGYSNGKGKGLSYWSPTINMARDPRWGRNHETYGEDPYLTTEIGNGFVQGLQGDDEKYLKVIATIKHYAANNSEYNRHTGSSNVDDRTLREYYTRAFKGIVRDSQVESVMSSYNRINGVPASANVYLLQTLLRETFGFAGYVTSDCGAINDVYAQHKWQPEGWDRPVDEAEATAFCITAGTDIDCGGVYKARAIEAVERGLMTEDDMDLALVRMFTARMKTGEFDPAEIVPYRSEEYSFKNQVEAEDHKQLAEDSANEAIVLLKNNGILPLDKNTQKNIVMIGEVADKVELSDYSGSPSAENMSTPIQGMQALGANVTYIKGGASNNTGTYICNMKNVTITKKNGAKVVLKASDAKDLMGCRYEETSGNIGYITAGATLKYENVDLTDIASISIQVAGDGSVMPGTISVTMDSAGGMQFASIDTQSTGGWQTYKDLTATVTDAGGATVKDIYLSFNPQKQEVAFTAQEKEQIKNADAVIVCIDGNKSSEGSDRATIVMPAHQSALANTAAGLNKNTIVYMQTVGVMEVGDFADNVSAILWTSFNGQAQGNAMARVIYGVANPNAKLPMTWYAKNAALATIDDYNIRGEEDFAGWSYQYYTGPVTYPFGYGLSYSTYEYSNLQIVGGSSYLMGDVDNNGTVTAEDALKALQAATQKITLTASQIQRANVDDQAGVQANDALVILQAATKKITLDRVDGGNTYTPDDELTVTVDVKNTSLVDGKETVQLYVAVPENDGVNRPFKQLKSFDKVAIAAGETKTVSLTLDLVDCYFWDEDLGKNVYDQGEYTLFVGPSSDEEEALIAKFTMDGELTPELMVVTATPDRLELNAANTNKVITTKVTAVMNDDTFYDLSKATVTYTSSNPDVVSVDENGIVRAIGGGVATVTASVTVGGKTVSDSFPVVVSVELEGIAVNGEMIEGFTASTTEYHMPVNELPVITVPGVPAEYITIKNPTSLPGDGEVIINMGGASNTYTIHFTKRNNDYVVARFSALEKTYTATNVTFYANWERVDGGQPIDFTTHDLDDLHLRFELDLKQTGNVILSDSEAYKSGLVKLRSKDTPNENNCGWGVGKLGLKTGHNYVDIKLSDIPDSRTGDIDWKFVDRMIFYIDGLTGKNATIEGTFSNVMVVDVSVDPEREALWDLIDDGVDETLYTPASLVAYRQAKLAMQSVIFQSTPVGADQINAVKEAYLDAKSKLVEDTYMVGTFSSSEGTHTVLNNGTGTIMYNDWKRGDDAPFDLSGDRSNLRLQLTVQFNSKVDTVLPSEIWNQFTIKLRSADRDDPNDPNNREHNYGWDYFVSAVGQKDRMDLSIDLSSNKTNSRGDIDWSDVERLIMMSNLSQKAINDPAANNSFSMTISNVKIVDLTNVFAEKAEIETLLKQSVNTSGASADKVAAYEKAVADAEAVCATEMATSEQVYAAHVALINAIDALK